MGLVRAIPLADRSTVVLTSGDNGLPFDLSSLFNAGLSPVQKLIGGIHMTVQSTDIFQAFIQSASSSGFAVATTELIFNAQTCRQGQWQTANPAGGVATLGSTDRKFFRTRWTLSTGSNAPAVTFLDWVSIR